MGNWNRRWRPRTHYYSYPEPPPSPPRAHRTESYPQGVGENSVPSWEMNFVSSMGVPWKKVVVAKKYMYCHDNIIQWNDSAGEEAFSNSKKRYWAEINGHHCDIPLPDPDIYIDEIDWSGYIDPELILDLDREYFNPEETDEVERVKIKNQQMHTLSPRQPSGWDVKNYNNYDDPWECSYVEGNKTSKDIAHGWSKWGHSMILKKADNPWEPSYGHGGDTLRDSAWGDHTDKSCDWKQGLNHTRQSNNFGKKFDKTLASGCQKTVGSSKAEGWEVVGNNFQGLKHWETGVQESKSWNKGDNSWENLSGQGSGAPKCRAWRDCTENYRGWNHGENQSNELNHLDFRRTNGHGRALNAGCRKREGPLQQAWRNKSSRFQENDYEIGHQWKMRGNQKRVGFA